MQFLVSSSKYNEVITAGAGGGGGDINLKTSYSSTYIGYTSGGAGDGLVGGNAYSMSGLNACGKGGTQKAGGAAGTTNNTDVFRLIVMEVNLPVVV